MTNFQEILKILHQHQVEFVLIGGLAAIAHGCAYATADLDIFYNRTPDNISKIISP